MRPTRFSRNEDGAITIDFLVLTATLVTIGLSLMTQLGGGLMSTASKTGDYLSNGANFDVSSGAGAEEMSASASGPDSTGSDTGEDEEATEGDSETGDDPDASEEMIQVIEDQEEEDATEDEGMATGEDDLSRRDNGLRRGWGDVPGRGRSKG